MNHWKLDLQTQKMYKAKLKKSGNFGTMVQIFHFDGSSEVIFTNKGKDGLPDIIQIYDCAGHNEYMLINTIALTEKSLVIIMFRPKHYFDHKCFYQTVGCYLDMVLSKLTDAAILLVAGRWDEMKEGDFLMKRNKEGKLQEAV